MFTMSNGVLLPASGQDGSSKSGTEMETGKSKMNGNDSVLSARAQSDAALQLLDLPGEVLSLICRYVTSDS